MSRSIGGATTWGNNGETWANTDPTNPSGTTWAAPAATSDLAARVLDDPATSQGQLVGPSASGTLRFVVQVLNPTLASDSVWGTAAWGTGAWSSSAGAWEDLSALVRSVAWANGVNGPLTKSQVGVATIILEDLDGLASPLAKSGHYTNGASSWLRTGTLVRFGVLLTGSLAAGLPALDTFSPFFTGRIESSVDSTFQGVDAAVTLTCVETTVVLASSTPVDQATQQSRALSSVVYEAMVDANWPYQTGMTVPNEDASVGVGALSGGTSASRLDLLTDGMHWDYEADGRGRILITRRHFATTDSGVTFANSPTGTQMPLAADAITPYSNVERLINDVTASRVTGPAVEAQDSRAIARFKSITTGYGFPRSDLILETDAQVEALLLRVLSLRAWDDLGLDKIEVNIDHDPVNLPAVLAFIAAHAREGYGFTVVYTHPSGFTFTEYVVIDGQSHTIAPVGQPGSQLVWTCTLTLGHAGTVGES